VLYYYMPTNNKRGTRPTRAMTYQEAENAEENGGVWPVFVCLSPLHSTQLECSSETSRSIV